jgi:hypothetical protein
MPCMDVLDATGHLSLTWDPADPESVSKAKAEFEQLKAAGFAFFSTAGKTALRLGRTGELRGELVQTKEFEPEAARTVAVRPMRGG